VYDNSRDLVLTAAIHGTMAVIDVSDSTQPVLVGSISPPSVADAHGLSYDFERNWAFIASVSQSTVTCVDVSDPTSPRVISTVTNTTWLYYSTHLSYDSSRSMLFVVSAGSGDESSNAGHSITSVSVGADGKMELLYRMIDWSPDSSPGVNKKKAYPVYSVLDSTRRLLCVE